MLNRNRSQSTRAAIRIEYMDLRVDDLERRRMLAGNVDVTFTGGNDLILRGDNADNQVQVSTNTFGDLVIQGLDGTTIELGGETAGSHTIFLGESSVDDMQILLRGGNDEVTVSNSNISGNLIVVGAAGDDDVTLLDLQIGGQVRAILSAGDDTASFTGLDVTERLTIVGGSGDENVTILDSTIGENASIVLSAGDDVARFVLVLLGGHASDGGDVAAADSGHVHGATSNSSTCLVTSLSVSAPNMSKRSTRKN